MSDAKHGETRMQAQARLLPVPTNTPGAVANITRRAALLGLSVPVVMAATATAAGLPDADGELLALCREFHKLSADIERLDVPGRSEETPEQVAAGFLEIAVENMAIGCESLVRARRTSQTYLGTALRFCSSAASSFTSFFSRPQSSLMIQFADSLPSRPSAAFSKKSAASTSAVSTLAS